MIKQALLTILTIFIVFTVQAQELSLERKNSLAIKNNLSFTHRFELIDGAGRVKSSLYLVPGQTGIIPITLSKRVVNQYKIRAIYDTRSYKVDLAAVKQEYEKRESNRLWLEALEFAARGLDTYFLEGVVFSTFDKAKIVVDILNGKDIEEVATDITVHLAESAIIESIDQKEARALASATLGLKDALVAGNYPDLNRYTNYAYERLIKNKSESHELKAFITWTVDYELIIEGFSPLIKNEYEYQYSVEPQIGDYENSKYPYTIRLSNKWYMDEIRPSLNIGYQQGAFLYKTLEPDSIFLANQGYAFQHIDLTLGMGILLFRIEQGGLEIGGELGGRANWVTSYSYEIGPDQNIVGINAQGEGKFDKIHPLLNLYANLDLSVVKIMLQLSGASSIEEGSGRTSNEEPSMFSVTQYQIGIGIPLFKKRSFENK